MSNRAAKAEARPAARDGEDYRKLAGRREEGAGEEEATGRGAEAEQVMTDPLDYQRPRRPKGPRFSLVRVLIGVAVTIGTLVGYVVGCMLLDEYVYRRPWRGL